MDIQLAMVQSVVMLHDDGTDRLTNCPRADWQTVWRTDWQTVWLTDWRTDWLSDGLLTGCLTDWLTDGLIDWLSDGLTMTELLSDGLIDWLFEGLTDWRSNWLPDGLTEWLTDGLTGCLTDGRNDWLSDGLTDCLTDGRTDGLSDGVIDWLTDWWTNCSRTDSAGCDNRTVVCRLQMGVAGWCDGQFGAFLFWMKIWGLLVKFNVCAWRRFTSGFGCHYWVAVWVSLLRLGGDWLFETAEDIITWTYV